MNRPKRAIITSALVVFCTHGISSTPAAEVAHCPPPQSGAPGTAVMTLASNLPDLSAPDCKTYLSEKTLKEVDEEYSKAFPGSRPYATLGGIRLAGTPEEVAITKKLLGKKPPGIWKRLPAKCKDVICALATLYGSEETAKRVLLIAKKSNYLMMVDQKGKPDGVEQVWSPDEVLAFDQVIRTVPDSFLKIPDLRKIVRIADGYVKSGHNKDEAASAELRLKFDDETGKVLKATRTIMMNQEAFYDKGHASKVRVPRAKYAFAHELCHHFDNQGMKRAGGTFFSEKPKYGFLELGSWSREVNDYGQVTWTAEGTSFVTPYAATDPREDFAESCAYYILEPALLKAKAWKKYDFLKEKVFNGKEYFPPEWPALQAQLTEPALCQGFALNSCFADVHPSPRGLAEVTKTRTKPIHYRQKNTFWTDSACVKTSQNELVATLVSKLKTEADYCDFGGERAIRETIKDSCKKNVFDRIATQSP